MENRRHYGVDIVNWTFDVIAPDHPKQMDGCNCGVFVMKVFKRFDIILHQLIGIRLQGYNFPCDIGQK